MSSWTFKYQIFQIKHEKILIPISTLSTLIRLVSQIRVIFLLSQIKKKLCTFLFCF